MAIGCVAPGDGDKTKQAAAGIELTFQNKRPIFITDTALVAKRSRNTGKVLLPLEKLKRAH